MKKLIIHPNPQISPQFIRGHPWSSEGTPEPDRNSQMEEIFVTKSQIVGTRVLLGTRGVWGPASRTQAKVPLKGSPAGLPGATDPGLLHHWDHSGSGSLLTPAPRIQVQQPWGCRLLITRSCSQVGWGGWVSWERGKLEPFLSGPLNQMPCFPSPNLPSKAYLEMPVLKQRKGTSPHPSSLKWCYSTCFEPVILAVIVHRSLQQTSALVLLGWNIWLLA